MTSNRDLLRFSARESAQGRPRTGKENARKFLKIHYFLLFVHLWHTSKRCAGKPPQLIVTGTEKVIVKDGLLESVALNPAQ